MFNCQSKIRNYVAMNISFIFRLFLILFVKIVILIVRMLDIKKVIIA